jgi:hypothetical protein
MSAFQQNVCRTEIARVLAENRSITFNFDNKIAHSAEFSPGFSAEVPCDSDTTPAQCWCTPNTAEHGKHKASVTAFGIGPHRCFSGLSRLTSMTFFFALLRWVRPQRHTMQIETIGKYQLHFIAHELGSSGEWEPFVTIFKFDDARQDFVCVLEKRRASDHRFTDYEQAIEAARKTGNELIAEGQL